MPHSYSIVCMLSMRQKHSCLMWASNLVRILAAISFIPINFKSMEPSAIHSWMKWYCTSMCFVAVRVHPRAEPGDRRTRVDPRDRMPFVGLDL